jgi:hypothetical protein
MKHEIRNTYQGYYQLLEDGKMLGLAATIEELWLRFPYITWGTVALKIDGRGMKVLMERQQRGAEWARGQSAEGYAAREAAMWEKGAEQARIAEQARVQQREAEYAQQGLYHRGASPINEETGEHALAPAGRR